MSRLLRLASVGHWPAVAVLVGLVLSAQLAAAQVTGNGPWEAARSRGPGAVRWLPALVPHDARNEGAVPLKLWVVLVKR